jgi:hypothetical protein
MKIKHQPRTLDEEIFCGGEDSPGLVLDKKTLLRLCTTSLDVLESPPETVRKSVRFAERNERVTSRVCERDGASMLVGASAAAASYLYRIAAALAPTTASLISTPKNSPSFTSSRGFVTEINPTHNVWAPATQLPDDRLPPLHTLLFNAFLVLDHNLRVSTRPIAIEKVRSSPSTSTPDDDDDDSASYVDFGFGNTAPGSTFCGFHRFSLNNFNSESATGIHIAVRVLPTDLDSNQGPDADLNHVSEITRSARNGLRRV